MRFYPRFEKYGDGKYRVIDVVEGDPVPIYTGDVFKLGRGVLMWAYRGHNPLLSGKWRDGAKTREEAAAKLNKLERDRRAGSKGSKEEEA